MIQYVKTILLIIAALAVVILAFGLGIVAVISVLVILPIVRFFLTRPAHQEAEEENPVIDVEYEIINEKETRDTHDKK